MQRQGVRGSFQEYLTDTKQGLPGSSDSLESMFGVNQSRFRAVGRRPTESGRRCDQGVRLGPHCPKLLKALPRCKMLRTNGSWRRSSRRSTRTWP